MATQIKTLNDARRDKARMNALTAKEIKANELAAADAEHAQFILQHPQIGMLIRKGRPVYYVFNNTDGPMAEGGYRENADPRQLVTA